MARDPSIDVSTNLSRLLLEKKINPGWSTDLLTRYEEYIIDTSPKNLNFARAAKIVEDCALAYSHCVDKLAIHVEDLQLILIKEPHGDGDGDHDDGEERGERAGPRAARQRRRPRRDAGVEEEFQMLDNKSKLSGKFLDDDKSTSIGYIKINEPYFNPFVRCGFERPKVDVRTKQKEDAKDSCLRDFYLNMDLMLVPELYANLQVEDADAYEDAEMDASLRVDVDSDDYYSESPLTPRSEGVESDMSEASLRVGNVNVRPLSVLFDVDGEQPLVVVRTNVNTWLDHTKKVTKPLKLGKTMPANQPCTNCPNRKRHKAKGRNCTEKVSIIEQYFGPHVEQSVKEPEYGLLPHSELTTQFRETSRSLARLAVAPTPSDSDDDDREEDFEGFDQEREGHDQGDERVSEDFNLQQPPMPSPDSLVPEDDILSHRSSSIPDAPCIEPAESATSRLGKRVTEWHRSIREELDLAVMRGAFDVNLEAEAVMALFPTDSPTPYLSFAEMVAGKNRRDIARTFSACLQLVNEGNLELFKDDNNDVTGFKKLRPHRVKEIDSYDPSSEGSSSASKRDRSASDGGDENVRKRSKKGANTKGPKKQCR